VLQDDVVVTGIEASVLWIIVRCQSFEDDEESPQELPNVDDFDSYDTLLGAEAQGWRAHARRQDNWPLARGGWQAPWSLSRAAIPQR